MPSHTAGNPAPTLITNTRTRNDHQHIAARAAILAPSDTGGPTWISDIPNYTTASVHVAKKARTEE